MKTLGEVIRQALQAKGLTQGQLTLKTGISQSHISKMLAGEHADARASTIVALSEGLGLDPVELLYAAAGKEPPDRPQPQLPPHLAALVELLGDDEIRRLVQALRKLPGEKRQAVVDAFWALLRAAS